MNAYKLISIFTEWWWGVRYSLAPVALTWVSEVNSGQRYHLTYLLDSSRG